MQPRLENALTGLTLVLTKAQPLQGRGVKGEGARQWVQCFQVISNTEVLFKLGPVRALNLRRSGFQNARAYLLLIISETLGPPTNGSSDRISVKLTPFQMARLSDNALFWRKYWRVNVFEGDGLRHKNEKEPISFNHSCKNGQRFFQFELWQFGRFELSSCPRKRTIKEWLSAYF